MQRQALEQIVDDLGECTEGFWWEFTGRAVRKAMTIKEIPISHRKRAAGETVVFQLSGIPKIATKNGIGLIKAWAQARQRQH
jgi:hypothetical protein